MLTEKQIKARFNKNHLCALVRRMLKMQFYHYHNGKKDETPSPHYTLRYGITPEIIADSVKFQEIWHSSTNSFCKLFGQYKWIDRRTSKEEWITKVSLRMREDAPGQYTILEYQNCGYSDTEKVDAWIQSHLMDHDCFMKNNTAIDIYI